MKLPAATVARWFAVLALSLALVSATACKKKAEVVTPPAGGDAAVAPRPLTAADIKPQFTVAGPADGLPERLEIRFYQTIFAEDDVDKVAAGETVFTVTPAIAGELKVASISQLTFIPSQRLPFATQLRVALTAVKTTSGVLTAPSADAWSYGFTTPKFGLVRLSQQSSDIGRGILQVHLVFSDAVDADDVKAHASWTVGGEAVVADGWQNVQPNVVQATLKAKHLDAAGGDVKVKLKAGVRSKVAKKLVAGAGEASLNVESGEPFEIQDVSLESGPTGYFINIICNDTAAGGAEYYYDRAKGRELYVSSRCTLDPDSAKETVHVSPAVKLDVAQGNRGFRILGAWKRGTYKLRIDAGARTKDGGVLLGAYDWSFEVPARTPSVGFVADGRYLPRSAWNKLPVKHVNVTDATLSVRRIPLENLVFWLNQPSETATPAVSDLVLDRYPVPLSGPPDEMATTFVDVSTLLPTVDRGLLELTLASGSSSQTRRLMLTDLQLVAKRAARTPDAEWKERLTVWALDMDQGAPVSGAEVKLLRPSGTALARCKTSGADGCVLEVSAKDVDPTPPFALIATHGDDVTYIKFDELKTEISDASVAGEPYVSDKAYRAAIYSDRGVYRPGDTAHLTAIVRDDKFVAPPDKMPVVMSLIDPRDKEMKRVVVTTNGAGMGGLDVPFGAFAATGRYRLQVLVADRAIGDYDFQVEEFVPERMKVQAGFENAAYLRDEEAKVNISARYLFGSVPDGNNVELTCELRTRAFSPKENADYTYTTWRPENDVQKAVALGKTEGNLDEEGKVQLACPNEAGGAKLEGAAEIAVQAAVFEAGSGRTTVGRATVPVHAERYYLGLKTGETRAAQGKAVSVTGVVVDWQGALAKGVKEVTVELLHLEQEHSYYYDEGEGTGAAQVMTRTVVDGSVTAAVTDGKFTASFTPTQDAVAFLIRASAGKTHTDLKLDGFGAYYAWQPAMSHIDRTPRPVRPTWIAIDGPKDVEVGKPVTVKLKAPYRGQMLFTVETNEVIQSDWKSVDGGDVSWTFTLDKFVPNVYVGAFLVKDPHLESRQAFLPDRAFGVRSIAVIPSEHAQKLTLVTPKEVRSNSVLTVVVEVAPAAEPTFVTVAAVDEGILSLTDFKSPDPIALLFAKRALGVETFETIGWALSLPAAGPSRSTGGDEEAQAGAPGRVQPVKPVALWSGIVPVGKDGKATVTFNVPLYRGSLRVMAVAADKVHVGAASTNVLVRDPLVVQTTMPRFMTFGDEIQIPVFLTNLSGATQKIEVRLTAEMLPVPGLKSLLDEPSPVELKGAKVKTLSLKNDQAGTVVFQAKAVRHVGAAKIRVLAKAGSIESKDEADVPLLPAGPKERVVSRVAIKEGKTDLKPNLTGWMPTSESTTFWITRNPYGEAFSHLTYLLHYPYG